MRWKLSEDMVKDIKEDLKKILDDQEKADVVGEDGSAVDVQETESDMPDFDSLLNISNKHLEHRASKRLNKTDLSTLLEKMPDLRIAIKTVTRKEKGKFGKFKQKFEGVNDNDLIFTLCADPTGW